MQQRHDGPTHVDLTTSQGPPGNVRRPVIAYSPEAIDRRLVNARISSGPPATSRHTAGMTRVDFPILRRNSLIAGGLHVAAHTCAGWYGVSRCRTRLSGWIPAVLETGIGHRRLDWNGVSEIGRFLKDVEANCGGIKVRGLENEFFQYIFKCRKLKCSNKIKKPEICCK